MARLNGPSEAVHAELEVLLKQARDVSYWESLVPGASVGAFSQTVEDDGGTEGDAEAHTRMMAEGWCRGGTMVPDPILAQMRTVIEKVHQAGWPTVFAFVYDVLWWPTRSPRLQRFAQTVLGTPVRIIPDFWAYYIPTSPTAHGYRPHREVLDNTMTAEGTPMAITSWLPITDATLDNGCMYVIPQNLELEKFPEAELRRRYGANIQTHGNLHRVRALPAPAGTVLCWNHWIKHWGGFSSSAATHPRISVAYEWIRADVRTTEHEHTRIWENVRPRGPRTFMLGEPSPNFKQRLFLIGRNMKRYLETSSADDVFMWMADVFLLSGYLRLGR